ncbi:hypothetical protein [Burkholderia plantarii]|uniref:hypothetical protein n=1 Tax=Burkholderia plantarii TaxID=41899 RepID=UPI0018DAFED5|nr:hypothetical protein [Burkholderia plantarii]MBI0328346.1 hypothetical protein [Burkholderia plantarii]
MGVLERIERELLAPCLRTPTRGGETVLQVEVASVDLLDREIDDLVAAIALAAELHGCVSESEARLWSIARRGTGEPGPAIPPNHRSGKGSRRSCHSRAETPPVAADVSLFVDSLRNLAQRGRSQTAALLHR